MQPRVLAGTILSAFDAAWAAWVADASDTSLSAYMAEACDLVDLMTRPMIEMAPTPKR